MPNNRRAFRLRFGDGRFDPAPFLRLCACASPSRSPNRRPKPWAIKNDCRAWPVRAVGGAHFAPPTHRTRRDDWIMGGPCRWTARSTETAMRSLRPLRRPLAPPVFPFWFAR